VIGDIKKETVYQIWHGKKLNGEHFSSYGDGDKSKGLHDVIDWMNS
jgi:hypothetical protein